MGYPGKFTDEIMDLVEELREVCISIGKQEAHPNGGGPGSSKDRETMLELTYEIRMKVGALDTTL